jgi:hypothetical protein
MQYQRECLYDLNQEHYELTNRNRELTLRNEQLKMEGPWSIKRTQTSYEMLQV